MNFSGSAILLDIEGTTSSVSFVYDVMFPWVRRQLAGFLEAHWGDVDVQRACDQIAQDAGQANLRAWCGSDPSAQRKQIETEVARLMDGDVKATGLKQLQGMVWREGFEQGEMKAHIYDDVPACIRCWRDKGVDVRIYSSGSVQAQHLFFGHTTAGNLLSLFTGHYDTTVGPKKSATSYARIMSDWKQTPSDVLFLSDVVAELDAAQQAGLLTGLCKRPGNAEIEPGHGHAELTSFEEVTLQ